MSTRDMQVLKALAELMNRNPEGVTYADLSSHLVMKGINLSKVWIYKCLSRLEDDGFVVAERISNPRLYITSQGIIAEALERKRKAIVDELKTGREEIDQKLKSVKSTSVEDLTMMAYDTIVGSVSIDSSRVIEGVEIVRSTLIKEFFQKAKKGDLIRVITPSEAADRGGETGGVTEMELLKKAPEGIELRALMVSSEDASRDQGLIATYLGDLKQILMEAILSGNLKMRTSKGPFKTYRMVSLNNNLMLLYLTHSPASDMAALVRREDNPGLLDDALNTFDRLFDEGIDIVEMMMGLLKEE